jgi:hypothetical protein
VKRGILVTSEGRSGEERANSEKKAEHFSDHKWQVRLQR